MFGSVPDVETCIYTIFQEKSGRGAPSEISELAPCFVDTLFSFVFMVGCRYGPPNVTCLPGLGRKHACHGCFD